MGRRIEDVQYCERLFQSFYDIGSTSQGGVTELPTFILFPVIHPKHWHKFLYKFNMYLWALYASQ